MKIIKDKTYCVTGGGGFMGIYDELFGGIVGGGGMKMAPEYIRPIRSF